MDKILLSGYFDRTQTHQNGVCEEEEEEQQQQQQQSAPAESVECEEQLVEPGMNHCCVRMTNDGSGAGVYGSAFVEQKVQSLKNSRSPLKWKQQRLASLLLYSFISVFLVCHSWCLTLSLSLQFVNRKFIPEATYNTSTEKEQGGEWAVSPEVRAWFVHERIFILEICSESRYV